MVSVCLSLKGTLVKQHLGSSQPFPCQTICAADAVAFAKSLTDRLGQSETLIFLRTAEFEKKNSFSEFLHVLKLK